MAKPRATKRKRALERETAAAEPTLQPVGASAACVTLAGLQRSIASLVDRIDSLPRRVIMSQHLLSVDAPLLAQGLRAAAREAAFESRVLASCKPLEGAAEGARVKAAQLEAYAVMLEREAGDGEERGVATVARTLLAYEAESAPRFVAVTQAFPREVVDDTMWVRRHIFPVLYNMRGRLVYQPGDNRVTVRVVDGERGSVESIEPEDAIVSLEGGTLASVTVTEAGVVAVVYRMPKGSVERVLLGISICGVELYRSPWTIPSVLGDSAVLATVASERIAAFLRELSGWLPGRGYKLLYRGTRDGMTRRAFHRLCDGKGPTLVLVRSTKGFVFGGYAGASWESNTYSYNAEFATSSDAFVLSVVGPTSAGPLKFPVLKPHMALWCDSSYGPCFYEGLVMYSSSLEGTFDKCTCELESVGGAYQDVLGKGEKSLTGFRRFIPVEVEVFGVTHP